MDYTNICLVAIVPRNYLKFGTFSPHITPTPTHHPTLSCRLPHCLLIIGIFYFRTVNSLPEDATQQCFFKYLLCQI